MKNKISLNILNEYDELKEVIIGNAFSNGGIPKIEESYDPKSMENIRNNSYPKEEKLIIQLKFLEEILKKYNVKIYKPEIINNYNQIFTRDISFVIENKLIIPNIINERKYEQNGINYILNSLKKDLILRTPENVNLEGGDVIVHNNYVFIGVSSNDDIKKIKVARSNFESLNFIQNKFQTKKVIGFELIKSDISPLNNALHLDCCFQPIGKSMALICVELFKNKSDIELLIDLFGKEKLIFVSKNEMKNMNCNILSVNPEVIISDSSFSRLNNILRDKGFKIEEIEFNEISKMGGLLRCVTLPLRRNK